MDKKELKKLWTQVAKGEISEKEAQDIIEKEKLKDKPKKHTHKRKKQLNAKGG